MISKPPVVPGEETPLALGDGAAPPGAHAPSAPALEPPIDDATFAEAHRQLLADRSIQFDMPQVAPPEMPQWLGGLGRIISASWPAVQILFWVAVAALVLFLLYVLAMHLSGREWRWGRAEPETPQDWRPDEAPARQLLGEADALAARGLFSEAAHLLLFRSIEDIDTRRPDLVRPALTSRDIAALDAIPAKPRTAFARIAMAVERSLFARRPLAETDWREARAAYEDFAFAEGWRG